MLMCVCVCPVISRVGMASGGARRIFLAIAKHFNNIALDALKEGHAQNSQTKKKIPESS